MSDEQEPYEPRIPWALTGLIEHGPAELSVRPQRGADLDIVIVLEPGAETAGQAGIPEELLDALERAHCEVTLVGWEDAADAADADLILAGGWAAAPEVLRVESCRNRGVLPGPDGPPLEELGWAEGIDVIGPRWMGGSLPAGRDEAYRPLPTHRREDIVHVHGQDPLSLLVAAEVAERRPGVEVVVSGMPFPASLPFEATAIDGGAAAVAHAFSLATVGVAPAVRGWRPVATAMLACGLPVVVPRTDAAALALGEAAAPVTTPAEGADAVCELLDDLALRAERSRKGLEQVSDWDEIARQIVDEAGGA